MKIPALYRAVSEIKERLAPQFRFIDIALVLDIVEWSDKLNGPVYTGEQTEMVGGVWDSWLLKYVDYMQPNDVHHIPVARQTLDYIMDEDNKECMLVGSRRAMKTHSGLIKCVYKCVKYPGLPGGITAPTYKQSRNAWRKILKLIPITWFKPSTQGIKIDKMELHLLNGAWIHFGSADKPSSIRSQGDAWHLGDETRDWKKGGVENVLFSLSEGGASFQWFEATTPSRGELQKRYVEYGEHPSCKIYHSTMQQNPFISPTLVRHLKSRMDPLLFDQEGRGLFVSLAGLVYPSFDRAMHVKQFKKWQHEDNTKDFTKARLGRAYTHVLGVDYNISPMCCLIAKVLNGNILFVEKEIILDKDADSFIMARELHQCDIHKAVIFDDASGEYSLGGRSGSRGFRSMGFRVMHAKRNPKVRDRVASVRAKLENVEGDITLFVDPCCKNLINAFENQEYDNNEAPEKGEFDHVLDALGYMIWKLFPIKNVIEQSEYNPILSAA